MKKIFNFLGNRFKDILDLKSKKTSKKIIIIESDDWGSIRNYSLKSKNNLIKNGILFKDAYEKYDCLESEEDIEKLFNVLRKYKDKNGNNPIFTANFAVANPNFKKIRENCFQDYYYETIDVTYKNYYGNNNILKKISEGIEKKLFIPQLHCREHLNVEEWMDLLRNKDITELELFNNNTIGISNGRNNRYSLMDEFSHFKYKGSYRKNMEDAINIFLNIFGYNTNSFIASCYTWDNEIEEILKENKIDIIQGGYRQNISLYKKEKLKFKYHYMGQQNKKRQIYMVRNCIFEPTKDIINNDDKTVEKCIKQIDRAFKHKLPAVICSHRMNYVSGICLENRENSLKQLDKLLNNILEKYPDVEFYSTNNIKNIY